jgi:DNA-binding MarR family transcriptional regulator
MNTSEWKLLEHVLRLTCGVTSRMTRLAKRENLPATALKILVLTSYSPFTCVSTLTECTGLQKGRISPLVQELVQRGYMTRHEGSDRRYSLLRLTPAGLLFLKELMVGEVERVSKVFAAYEGSDEKLISDLEIAADHLGFNSVVPSSEEE